MEWRSQRRLLARQPAEAHLTGRHRPRVSLPDRQRGGAGVESTFPALVDAAPHRAPQAISSLRTGLDRILEPRKSARDRFRARLQGGAHPRRCQLVALRSIRRARAFEVQGDGAHRALRPITFSTDRGSTLSFDARLPRLLLVLPPPNPVGGRTNRRRGSRASKDKVEP